MRVVEGTRERVQVFQGAVIRRQGSGARGRLFTVRKVSFGVGVERTFPVHSPVLAKIEMVTRGDVRRAKLYYQRDRIGRPPRSKRSGQYARRAMSEEDLERDQLDIELALVQEYRTVLPLFNYVVETERRFYLANEVKVSVGAAGAPTCIEVELTDAWVWKRTDRPVSSRV